MNDRLPRTECGPVLVDVKARPSGWPAASLDPDSGRGPQATSGTPALRGTIRITNLESLRFQGIATPAQSCAVPVMKVGPSGSPCRRGAQTTGSCVG